MKANNDGGPAGGGPAFPRGKDCFGSTNDGMSLRTYIATAALTGWASGRNLRTEDDFTGPSHHRKVAAACVLYADALIAELNNP